MVVVVDVEAARCCWHVGAAAATAAAAAALGSCECDLTKAEPEAPFLASANRSMFGLLLGCVCR